MRIGLLGGTFNPIHMGHLILAQECRYQLSLEKVIFVPAYAHPLKEADENVSAPDRLNMVRLALEGDDRFEISTFEIDAGGISYSIETIKHFKKKYDDLDLFFITGADSAKTLPRWKDVEDILNLSTFVVATRPGWEDDSILDKRIKRIIIPGIDISSTMIREKVSRCEPIDCFVPGAVSEFIRKKGLYKI